MLEALAGLGWIWSLGLILAVLFVLAYEFINGFHDTANAVATVIYTNAMPARGAVLASALFNFAGVLLGGLGVAYAIVHLLPVGLLLDMDSSQGLLLVFSLLFSAIVWNLGTWFFGIPASSSHTLIGSIMGVGGAYAWLNGQSPLDGVNTGKAIDIMLSLLLSPTLGFILAAILLLVMKRIWRKPKLHRTPAEQMAVNGKKHPPFWARITLIASAMGVSFAHGSNDGQKGIGLVMLVLICMAPGYFALDLNSQSFDMDKAQDANRRIMALYERNPQLVANLGEHAADSRCQDSAIASMQSLDRLLEQGNTVKQLTQEQRRQARQLILCIDDSTRKLAKQPLPAAEVSQLKHWRGQLNAITEYAPLWVIVAVALALGCGTMVGWRRIVHTVGEKIGNGGMTYSQGIAAQLTAAGSIGIASMTGMPVSTTHILSSAVAGTMVANGSGLQKNTIKQILLTWVLTLPMTIVLSAGLFMLVQTFFA
ncbi:inorganic phosphate transporter [Shewanella algae]|uniref:inorganic phosphate transporter n=1 Tax=Shewanella algae TaxID=38313 RepID=UPI00118210EF|nr:inorganic phosphate transporter [Shewanella algae]TVL13294.1 nuclease PIN [Shewanella algae]